MTGILLCGCGGTMGRAVLSAVSANEEMTVVAGVDLYPPADAAFPVFTSPAAIDEITRKSIDVIIDFSNPAALSGLLEFAVANGIPAVIATTGLADAQKALLQDASKKIPVFFSANMSLGINLICELAKKAARVLGCSFDIEIVEMHHNRKLDAPSGTALMLADAINGALETPCVYEYDRHSRREKRPKQEIGIHAVRGGTITGEHEIIFAGNDEIIRLSHSARSRALFATGALNAARYLCGKPAGNYSMADLLAD